MRRVTAQVLQEYLESLSGSPANAENGDRHRELLGSYAELKFRLTGGGHCQVCRAHVRHVLPIRVQRADGSAHRFECLCQRCLQAEHATAHSVEIGIGRARWVLKKPKSHTAQKTA